MPSLKYYFKKARKEKWAVGHFNFYSQEHLEAIIRTAAALKSPVIVATSERQSKIFGLKKTVALVKNLRKELRRPVFLHLDHGHSFDYIKRAIDGGYDAVHFDGSSLPLPENIKITKKIVKYAKSKKVLVEGEVGVIGGALTEPKEAQKFVKETKVDSLAANVGTIHGIRKSGKNPPVNLKRLKEIKDKAEETPLVLHGGSGTAAEDIRKAIGLGVVKINIGTEIKRAETFSRVKKVVGEKIKLFKSANKI